MSDFTSGTLTATGTAPTGINNSASQLILYTTGCGGAAFTVSNAAGTVGFWASADGGMNWSALAVSPANGGALVTLSSTTGLWQLNCSGYTHVGLVATAITGGGINASIHTSPISAFESGGGGGPGGGGMVPTGSTGIVSSLFTTTGTSGPSTYNPTTGALNIPTYGMIPAGSTGIIGFTTTGASGASTYNPSTGAMNIPIYAPGTINQVSGAVPASLTNNTTAVVSSGFGIGPFTALFNPLVAVCWNWNVQLSGVNLPMFAPIYRTTGTIPANGAAITTGDVELIRPRTSVAAGSGVNSVSGTLLDTTLLVGTAYRYYLGLYTGSGSQTITLVQAPAGTVSLQVVELK